MKFGLELELDILFGLLIIGLELKFCAIGGMNIPGVMYGFIMGLANIGLAIMGLACGFIYGLLKCMPGN